MNLKKFFKASLSLLKDTFKGFGEHNVTKLSGSLSYSTVFSMGPLLVVIISLCGLFLEREAIEGKVYAVLQGFVGNDTAIQLQGIIKNASVGNKSSIALVIGLVTLFFGATAVFSEIQSSVNVIWGIKPKPKRGWLKFIQNRFLSFSVIISLGFLLLVSLGITGIIEAILNRLKAAYPDSAVIVFYIINMVITLVVSWVIFAVIFKVLPDAKIKWKDVMVGAFVTAFLFLLGKSGISIYISSSNVGSTFGAAGSIVVLLVWVYYSSIILYLGAEFTKAYAIKYGSAIHPSEYAVTMKEIVIEQGNKSIQEQT